MCVSRRPAAQAIAPGPRPSVCSQPLCTGQGVRVGITTTTGCNTKGSGKVFWGLTVKLGGLEGLLSSTQAVTGEKNSIRLFPTCYSTGKVGKILYIEVVTKDTRVSTHLQHGSHAWDLCILYYNQFYCSNTHGNI